MRLLSLAGPVHFPLLSTVSIWGYGIVIIVAALIVGAMVFVIKASSGSDEQAGQIKEMIEALFGTPAHLRPGGNGANGEAGSGADEAAASRTYEPFEDVCPACEAVVTHEHRNCPSCGLRLLG